MNEKLKRLQQLFEALSKSSVYVGVIGGTHTDEKGQTFGMPELAAVHEFGVPEKNIPERSPIRKTLKEHETDYTNKLAGLVKKAVSGGISPDAVYGTIGAIAAGDIQRTIKSGQLEPLQPETIRRKGSSVALIDTAQLVQSYTWDVRND